MILYSFRRCPYAMRARMALRYSAVDLNIVEVSLKAKPPEMLALSSKGTVPVLQVDGMRLLGTGSAGTALLSTLSDAEIVEFHARQRQELAPQRAVLSSLQAEIRAIRQNGYATTDDLVAEGVGGASSSCSASTAIVMVQSLSVLLAK